MKILLIRFSALGDLALCLPVIRDALYRNPELQIDLLTKPQFQAIFANIDRLQVLQFDVYKNYKGFFGLFRLYNELKHHNYDILLDLHSSLRTRILKFFFSFQKLKKYTIDKGKEEKKSLLGKIYLNSQKLKHTTTRYSEVFLNAGFKVDLSNKNFISHGIVLSMNSVLCIDNFIQEKKIVGKRLLGIAPFSQHLLKEWPLEKITELINQLLSDKNNIIFLFGVGSREINKLKSIQVNASTQFFITKEHFNFEEELALMSRMNSFLSMDSANLHLAELSGCKSVFSIWGPTHSNLGFSPFFSDSKNIIQIDPSQLNCRPCSIFGNTTCHRGDHVCMNWIEINSVLEKLKSEMT